MIDEEPVEPQVLDQQPVEQEEVDTSSEDAELPEETQETEQQKVPLSALQKERSKRQEEALRRQEAERELAYLKQPRQPDPVQEDDSIYESATKGDLRKVQAEAIRAVEERSWIRTNPEKYELLNEQLETFLKQRPNLARAIDEAPNRYEEAYLLMTALSPKQQQQLQKASSPKKVAPNSPTSIPKAAAINQGLDVMNMSDSEFNAWRKEKKQRR